MTPRTFPRKTMLVMCMLAVLCMCMLTCPFGEDWGAEGANVTITELKHSPAKVNKTSKVTYSCKVSGDFLEVRLHLKTPDSPQEIVVVMDDPEPGKYSYTHGPYNAEGFTVRYKVVVIDQNLNATQNPSDGSYKMFYIEKANEPSGSGGDDGPNMQLFLLLGAALVVIIILIGSVAGLAGARNKKKMLEQQKKEGKTYPSSAVTLDVPGRGRRRRSGAGTGIYGGGAAVRRRKPSDRVDDRDLYADDGADALYEDELDVYYGDGYDDGYGEPYNDGYDDQYSEGYDRYADEWSDDTNYDNNQSRQTYGRTYNDRRTYGEYETERRDYYATDDYYGRPPPSRARRRRR